MTTFHLATPSLDSHWRSIILFGRNVASYKFALAKTLLELSEGDQTQFNLSDLAPIFSRHICEHLSHSDKQSTSRSSQFLDTCRRFNLDEISSEQLSQETVKSGFNNVIDAFHVVNQAPIETQFFVDDRQSGGGITLTDAVFQLRQELQGSSFSHEIEARWRLVETAWSLNIGRNLIEVQADAKTETLFVQGQRRINITSSRDALNGYQKGRCFYCFDEISVDPKHPALADVDHFFPWVLKRDGLIVDADGVWNLVLACRNCNRGQYGKMARVPSVQLLERLHQRNSYLIDSHHPLRETLIRQTGSTEPERRTYLQDRFDRAVATLVHLWEPEPRAPNLF
jgi:hypothetical protein